MKKTMSVSQMLSARFLKKAKPEIEIEAITKSGKKIPFHLNGKLVNYEGSPCLIGMGIADISERVKAGAGKQK